MISTVLVCSGEAITTKKHFVPEKFFHVHVPAVAMKVMLGLNSRQVEVWAMS